jgi:epoxyqueuosine reductase
LPHSPAARYELLAETATVAGLDRFGAASVEPFEDTRRVITSRKGAGLHGGLTFTYTRPERSTDVRASLPWAQTLLVAGRAYLPAAGDPGPAQPGTGRIARFSVEDSYAPLRAGLEAVAGILRDAGFRAELLVDDNRLVDRAAAVRAGVGWWGKNTMVLAPGQGPWMLLGSVVTDAEVAHTAPMQRDCGSCEACLPACPTGALVAPGVLDARRCLAAIAQLPGSIPEDLREAMGDRIYGCDDCLDACPPGGRLADRAAQPRGRVELRRLLEASDEALMSEFSRFYLPRRKPTVLRRNALVATGNSGRADLASTVAGYLQHEDPVLAEHARWALRRLTGEVHTGGSTSPSDDRTSSSGDATSTLR